MESAAAQTRAYVSARRTAPACTATRAEIEKSGWREALCEMLESAVAQCMGQLAQVGFYRLDRFIEALRDGPAAVLLRKACDAPTVKISREEAEAVRVLFHIGLFVRPDEAEKAELERLILQANPDAFTSALREFKHQYNELKEVAENADARRDDDNPYMLNTHRYLLKRSYGPWLDEKFAIERAAQWLATHTLDEPLPGLALWLPLDMTQDIVHDQVFWAKHIFGAGVIAWLWELATGRCMQNGSLVFGENASDPPKACPPLEESIVEMMVELDPDAEPPRHWIIRTRLHLAPATGWPPPEVVSPEGRSPEGLHPEGPEGTPRSAPRSPEGTGLRPTNVDIAGSPQAVARRPRFGFQTKMPAISIVVASPGPFGAAPPPTAPTATESSSPPPPSLQ